MKAPPLLIVRAGQDRIPNLNTILDQFVQKAIASNLSIDFLNHPEGVHGFENKGTHPRTTEIIKRRRMMQKIKPIFVFLFFCTAAYGQTTPPTPSPCKTDPVYRQFDFWIGEWDVENPNGQIVGRSSIQLIEGDYVLLENYASVRNPSYTGKSFNVFNAAIGRWQQFWVDSQGAVLEFKGEYKDRELRYTAESIGPQNQRTHHKLTFVNRENGTVRQLWEQSTDEGSTWTVAFDGLYRKRK